MNVSFRYIASALGIDKSIAYTSSARILQAFTSVVTIVFIARFLSEEEQGYYYTFGSIVAVQIFFELGFNGIITQYVAHESSHLEWIDSTTLAGESKYLSRLSSLLHFSIRWYVFFAGALLITLVIIGLWFFSNYDVHGENVNWMLPWILLTLGTGLNLLLTPILAYLEGLNKVKEVAKIRFYQQLITPLAVWICLLLGGKLFASCLNCFAAIAIFTFSLLFTNFKPMLLKIWNVPIVEKVSYRNEIFPYQWKIALSWISGYFIFQLFNPVLFATEGAVVAGQMGITLTALNGIQALSMSWMSTKVPTYSSMIAQHQYSQLDDLFNRTLRQSVLINGTALCLFGFLIFIVRFYHVGFGPVNLGDRFLSYVPMVLVMIPLFLNQFVSSWAVYLRCHKREPYLINSLVGGALCCISTVLMGKYYGVMGVTSGYCIITIFLFCWGYWIYKTKKYEWHKN